MDQIQQTQKHEQDQEYFEHGREEHEAEHENFHDVDGNKYGRKSYHLRMSFVWYVPPHYPVRNFCFSHISPQDILIETLPISSRSEDLVNFYFPRYFRLSSDYVHCHLLNREMDKKDQIDVKFSQY